MASGDDRRAWTETHLDNQQREADGQWRARSASAEDRDPREQVRVVPCRGHGSQTDGTRYDMLCFEGIALMLNIFNGKTPVPKYRLEAPANGELQTLTVSPEVGHAPMSWPKADYG
jgi:nucleoid-associated protein YgaU